MKHLFILLAISVALLVLLEGCAGQRGGRGRGGRPRRGRRPPPDGGGGRRGPPPDGGRRGRPPPRGGRGRPPPRPTTGTRGGGGVRIVGGRNSDVDWRRVEADIVDSMRDRRWDDGSWAPIYLRLAWHAAGTYDPSAGVGGPDGATMRFAPERDYEQNKGLDAARRRLARIGRRHRDVSSADLWSLAGAAAVSAMGGPSVRWAPGRRDAVDGRQCPPDDLLPAVVDQRPLSRYMRDIFDRMGFNDSELVALIGGGHSVGRMHRQLSGFDGVWTNRPTRFSNDFFRELLDRPWREERKDEFKSGGRRGRSLTMLSTDMVLSDNAGLRQYAVRFRDNRRLFFSVFASAFEKLLHLGVEHLL